MKIIKEEDSIVLIEEEKKLHFIDSTQTNVLVSQDKEVQSYEVAFQTGPPGKSAYEVALDEGFVGTKDEWIDSLKENFNISQQEEGNILTTDGVDYYWISLEDRLNSDSIQWDLGEF